MSIWFNKNIDIDVLQPMGKGNIGEVLGLSFVAINENSLQAKMPVDHRTRQPYGLLHGGASVVLAETLGSVASMLVVDNTKFMAVGLEVNANHIRGVKEGFVIGTCTPLHLGASTHVWDIKIHTETGKLVCISRLTVAIIKQKN